MQLAEIQSNKTMSSREIAQLCNKRHDNVCCHEAIRTDNKVKIHIIDPQDEHHHDKADNHVFMLNGLLATKDVAMPKAGV